jgi:predicted TIM-barrel fold metal-dependent hydrolase
VTEQDAIAPRLKPRGTNYPMVAPTQALEDLASLELDDETLELFLHGNARRVFALD